MTSTPEIWAVADGRRGVENQAIGLAEALATECGGQAHRALIREDGYVTLPDAENPTVWIGCGRPAIRVARQHKKSFPDARFVYVQDPRGQYDLFDAIIAPAHDRLKRPNAISMTGSPNRLTAQKLADGAATWMDALEKFNSPRAVMLIGGPNKRLSMTKDVIASICARAEFLALEGFSVLVTTSRRTPQPLVKALTAMAKNDRFWVFSGEGENPYFGFLAAADYIFVTEDSTNMLTEAAFTGKPVYSLPLDGNPGKFRLLHADLEARNVLRPFLGRLDSWSYAPLDESRRIARLLAGRFALVEPVPADGPV
jgi:uncharacterized protein